MGTSAAPLRAAPVRPWGSFLGWAAVTAAFGMALLSILSIGLFLVPVPVILTAFLLRTRNAQGSLWGLMSGAAVAPLFLAYTNRSGPGTICNLAATACVDEIDPWPWALVGVALLVAGVLVFSVTSRPGRTRSRSGFTAAAG